MWRCNWNFRFNRIVMPVFALSKFLYLQLCLKDSKMCPTFFCSKGALGGTKWPSGHTRPISWMLNMVDLKTRLSTTSKDYASAFSVVHINQGSLLEWETHLCLALLRMTHMYLPMEKKTFEDAVHLHCLHNTYSIRSFQGLIKAN